MSGQRPLALERGSHRFGRVLEGDKESIALSVDLPAAMCRECLSQHEPMRLKEPGPGSVAQAVGEAGRPFHVTEEKRYDAFRKSLHATDASHSTGTWVALSLLTHAMKPLRPTANARRPPDAPTDVWRQRRNGESV